MKQEPQTTLIDGNEVSGRIRDTLREAVVRLRTDGVTPRLATVRMGDDGTSKTYVSMKQRACSDLGIQSEHHEVDTDEPSATLLDRIEELNADPDVDGIVVQRPLPVHINERDAFRRIDPEKDVDGFHPENVGRLVTGDPRFKPCTPHGIQRLLSAYDIETDGRDAVVVGRSNVVGRPTANLLLQRAPGSNATVTVCHSRTTDLAQKTRGADIVVAATGVPELIDAEMLSAGAVVVDVGINRVDTAARDEPQFVGDVDFESASQKARAITPVPGGVGPMTIAMLLYNTVKAAGLRADVSVDLP
ncbi:bifunctional 5,10-methylenetetrahydrofolate dehydrogenase/5,10-methenyltetrahydrofolate cyclohydrolase [Halobellus clavatus]|jgi:methylenetetrahydrofolate dehydrogenase (NADP+)/methenyltetrahydrofolate cyclohydrolase|uniref:Bifunctional protein FolD n=1 Tax=Halobellus clavatus TaxID=660517 RepID=A0A1H3FR84_9EURY|nr:tetrahydrofolate dehydrogenase/cyclohydrolase catalytic domain-containing protein [Halobellus clavatus]SDX93582.1 methylenetetrahydrofolate dehydrogenase (NADP+) / methenyltetrahydrofolate cyclohydrolase [Halobellus clavatus]